MFVVSPNGLISIARRHIKSLIPFITFRKFCNIIRASTEMLLRKESCKSRPFMIKIDPCTACNLRCVSCESHTTQTKRKRIMDLPDFKTIIDKLSSSAIRATLYDVGEPLLNKNIYQIIGYASDNNISTLISTNFNLFDESKLDDLFNSRLTVLEPCMDGFTQDVYSRYRCAGDIDVVKHGIELVTQRKRETKSKWPVVDVHIVLFEHVKPEVPQIEKFLLNCGVDGITYKQENLGFGDNANDQSSVRPGTTAKGNMPCFWLYLGIVIRPDGCVYPCCGHGFDRFSYGNIFEQDLDQIWNNKFYRFSRKLFSKGPDVQYDRDFEGVPCLKCPAFKKQRTMCSPTTS